MEIYELLREDHARMLARVRRLAAQERANKLLQRDIRTVDMRLPDRLVLRAAGAAPGEAAPAKKRASGKST